MFSILIPKIKTTLESVSELAVVYDYPESKYTGYPAAIFFPVAFDNQFLTNEENLKGFNFKIVIITESKVKGTQNASNVVLAKAVDAVISQFDQDWSQGALDGHRIWWKLNAGDWAMSVEQDSKMVYAELNLIVNLMTNN